MRRILATAAITAFSIPLFAGVASAASDNANANACFGQGRAAYSSGDQPLGSTGSIISDRAREESETAPNANVEANRNDKGAGRCTAP